MGAGDKRLRANAAATFLASSRCNVVMRLRYGLPLVLIVALFGAFATASGATPAVAPAAQVVGTPVLITVTGKVGADRPTAYAFFRLAKHLHEPRLVVAQVKGKSGRTFAVRGTMVKNCYRSALLLEGSPAGHLRAGITYRVSFISRATAHQSATGIKPFASFKVKAQARSLVRGSSVAPACPR